MLDISADEKKRKPSFGARVRVLFDDGNYYWGTINTHGDVGQDVTHPDGPWSVLFDDCTQERFKDNEKYCKSWMENIIIVKAGYVR